MTTDDIRRLMERELAPHDLAESERNERIAGNVLRTLIEWGTIERMHPPTD